MSRQRSYGYHTALLVGTLLYAAGFSSIGHADVTPSGLNTTVNVVGGNFNITGGTRPNNGANLFHSFGNFSLNTPESANFLNDSGLATKNILSRVTGGNPSSIFGTIDTSAFGSANLFLMNPAGIIFGPTAQLNVGGSFHATTADYIKLGNDGIFYSDPTKPTLLSVAPPSAFGFLTSNPAAIDVNTSNLLVGAPGQTISFVGGPVNVGAADGSAPGYVLSPAGRVNLVSVASAGEAVFDGTGFNVDGFSRLGDASIRGGSIIDGKEIVIRGGSLTIDDALLAPGVFSLFGLPVPLPDGGEVNIKVSGDVNITGTPGGTPALFGFASGVFVFAGGDGATVLSPGKVPDIKIEAQNLRMSGTTGLQNNRLGPGLPGDIVVNADTVTLQNGANIATVNAYEGPGGNIVVNAKQVTLSGDGTPNPAGFEGIAAQGVFNPLFGSSVDPALTDAGSGNITINASQSLSVGGTAQITTDSLAFGRGGDITINAGDMHLASTGEAERAGILAQSALAGDAGNITINATGTIELSDGFRISASTGGSGNGGSVQVTAGRGITMTGANSRILSGTAQPPDDVLNALFLRVFGISFDDLRTNIIGDPSASLMQVLAFLNSIGVTAVADLTPGDAGAISITAPVLTMNADTRIEASTGWEGNAGAIVAHVNSLSLNDGASIRNRSGLELLAGGVAVGPGNAGTVNITATDTISLSGHSPTSGGGSAITTSTLGDGNAGNISLNANQVNVENGGSVSSASGGTVNGQLFVGAGNAGQIAVSTPTLTMANGGTISVATSGVGSAGSILLNANTLSLAGGSQVVSSTSGAGQGGSVSANATDSASISGQGTGLFSTASGTGNAGQINVSTPTLTMGDGGTISVATSGAGNAGNIALNASNFSLTDGSQVVSSTSGSGQGGSVSANATESASISGQGTGLFSTASSTGNAGQINVSTPTLTMGDGGTISVATSGAGNAGNIALNVTNLTQTGGARVDSSTSGGGSGGDVVATAAKSASISGSGSGLFSNASSTGNAGQITVTTPTLTMDDGGAISVATSGGGNAGNIALNVTNFTQTGGARVDSSTSGGGLGGDLTVTAANSASISGSGTGMFSTASSTGAGGDIKIQAGQLVQLTDDATVSAQSTGTATATAGNITINAPTFEAQNGSVTTGATLADGGNISITTTGSLVHLTDSQITTSVLSGFGSGGNIAIDSKLIVLDESQILANAFGGPGGNINITGDVFLVNSGGTVPTSLAGIVQASSTLSTSGTVNIEATFTNVTGSVTLLPETPLQATELLRASCAARFAGGKTSSLVVGGRGGLPLQPGDLLPSPLYVASDADAPSTGTKVTGYDQSLRFSLLGSKDRLLSQYSLLPNAKCAL